MVNSAGRAKRWAAACLLAGTGWLGMAQAQTAPAPAPTPLPVVAPYKAAPPTAPAPAATAAPCDACQTKGGTDFSKVPQVQFLQRPGYGPVFPTGCGYYSLLDQIQGNAQPNPPKYPYPRVGPIFLGMMDFDWRYLDDPKNTEHDFFDFLKRQRLGDNLLFTTGGEFRYRYNHEVNSRLAPGGRTNDYQLYRTRMYGDLMVTDNLRLFVEGFTAQTFDQNLPPLIVDRDRADLLNAFADIRVGEIDCKPVWLRVGRQELVYGSQRLLAALDWVNVRRSFDGIKAFWANDDWSVDAFCVQPVIANNERFNSVDNNQVFSGLWTTHRSNKTETQDFYVLNLDRAGPAQVGNNGRATASNITTVGGRAVGLRDQFLYDAEVMLQGGTYGNQNLWAQAVTTGAGWWFKDAPGTPTFWLYYDYASGDNNPGRTNTRSTFDQLFPFGHYYFGFIDQVGRRNIHDLNAIMTFYPTPWLQASGQFHMFYLDSRRDALYGASGAQLRRDPTGRAGRHVGEQFDLFFNFHLDKHSDLMISYSYMFSGSFLDRTATPANSANALRDPQALYVQYSYRW